MIIKILLITFLAIFFLYFINNSTKIRARAWQKITILMLPFLGVVSVVWPDGLNTIAKLIGIGRGADLLLYCLVVVFLFFGAKVYLKFKEVSIKQDKIISKIALLEKEKEK